MTVFQEVGIDSKLLIKDLGAEDALSNDVKRYDIFSWQGTENPPFRFFWGTPGIGLNFTICFANWQYLPYQEISFKKTIIGILFNLEHIRQLFQFNGDCSYFYFFIFAKIYL